MSINYQWQVSTDGGDSYNNIAYSGTVLTLSGIKPEQHNNVYRCRMNRESSNKYAYSESATLTVVSDIQISKTPELVSISGGSLSLNPTVTTDNSSITTTQWQYSDNNGSNFYDLAAETGSTLSLSNLTSANNNWIYRLQVVSYYATGIKNSKFSNNTKVAIDTDLPEMQIWREPQNYYGTGNAVFDIVVSSTGLNGDGIPNTFYGTEDGVGYSWEQSIDGQNWKSILNTCGYNLSGCSMTSGVSSPEFARYRRIHGPYMKDGHRYRVNVSKGNHTILSESAFTYDSLTLPNLSGTPSTIQRNYFRFTNSNQNLFAFLKAKLHCSDPISILKQTPSSDSSQAVPSQDDRNNVSCTKKLRLLTLQDGSDRYDLVTDNIVSTEHDGRNYINDIVLYKNNRIIKTASINSTKTIFSRTINNVTPTTLIQSHNNTYVLTKEYVGVAGRPYGKGYCINFNTPLHADSFSNSTNYLNLFRNCIAKASSTKYGNINVGIITTGNSTADTNLISKLPSKINLSKNSESLAEINATYTIVQDTSNLSSYNVIILNNSYNWSSRRFSDSEQNTLKAFVNDGGGLITGEWVLWNAANNRFKILQEVFAIIPSSRYSSNTKMRLYQFSMPLTKVEIDDIVGVDVDMDFNVTLASIAGTQVWSNKISTDVDFMLVNEVSKKDQISDTLYYEEAEFNILNTFNLLANKSPNEDYILSFYWGPSISKDLKIGGCLYWIYKSLIEYYRKPEPGTSKISGVWKTDLYNKEDNGLNKVLADYGLQYQDFDYVSNSNEILSDVIINDKFWKDLSRLLGGLKPQHSLTRDSTELKQHRIDITKQPLTRSAIKLDNNEANIICTAISSEGLPINYSLYKQSGEVLTEVHAGQFRNKSIFVSGVSEGDYQLTFRSSDAEDRSSVIFSLNSNGSIYGNSDGPTMPSIRKSNIDMPSSGTFVAPMNIGEFLGWQYSYDNKNFYNTTDNVTNYTTGTIITGSQMVVNSGDYQKYFRLSYEFDHNSNSDRREDFGLSPYSPQGNLIGYSKDYNYDPEHDARIIQNINNEYAISGIYYTDINYVFVSGSVTNIDNLIWQKYNSSTNTYESIPNVSGHSVLLASGIPVNLVDNLEIRAILNNRTFYQ